jgi:hypothetical protein
MQGYDLADGGGLNLTVGTLAGNYGYINGYEVLIPDASTLALVPSTTNHIFLGFTKTPDPISGTIDITPGLVAQASATPPDGNSFEIGEVDTSGVAITDIRPAKIAFAIHDAMLVGTLDADGEQIDDLGTPVNPGHASRKDYTDTKAVAAQAAAQAFATAADIVILAAAASASAALEANDIRKDGSRAFTGNQDMGVKRITNAQDPVDPQDYATKAWILANPPAGMREIVHSELTSGDVGIGAAVTPLGVVASFTVGAAKPTEIKYTVDWTGNSAFCVLLTGIRIDGAPADDIQLGYLGLQIGAGSDHAFGASHHGSIALDLAPGAHTIEVWAYNGAGSFAVEGTAGAPVTLSVNYPT